MEVQLQRLLTLERDHELREGSAEDKLFFHLTRASACVLGEEVIFKGSKVSKRRIPKRREKGILGTAFMVLTSFCLAKFLDPDDHLGSTLVYEIYG
ncbi:hypothetical protein TIFTF001_056484 [Ficus carica]|uniref:Uncharacterized protein n=1 Tax=Ficus carica TaxID=3494 RepID=A0AA88EIT8_FICCA|nr:hypothetical protein TIFTF001_056482 [Ficus carica]GMN75764.1 hypothetical protein TIFTF001_056484 [Ficus carica]